MRFPVLWAALPFVTLTLGAFAVATTILLACLTTGCASGMTSAEMAVRDSQVSTQAAGTTIETLEDVALVLYRAEQEAQVAIALNLGENKSQVKERVAAVRKSWESIWDAFEDSRSVYAATAALLSQSPPPGGAALQSAVNKQQLSIQKLQTLLSVARQRMQMGSP